jgi:methylated-DNA-protein-cysteine methyltransferase related protein
VARASATRTRTQTRAHTHNDAFVARVYEVIRAIPRGNVATYGLVAALAGFPGRARAVGWALRVMAPGLARRVPWHRVVGAAGRIAVRVGDSASRQRQKLRAEGVSFRRGRIDMARHDYARATPTRG